MREASEHLFARHLEMRPLSRAAALPMKVAWKMIPYLGVLLFVFKARKRAFSAPRIWTVEAGYLARLVRLPACAIRRAATSSPIRAARLGATTAILRTRYVCRRWRYSPRLTTRFAKALTFSMSKSEISVPIDVRAASTTSLASASSPRSSSSPSTASSVTLLLFPIFRAARANMMLSFTIRASSGKCQEYHSFTRMANVLISLSSWSRMLIVWMMWLSARLMLNLIFERE
mmetsp:Transcript_22054/g.86720  ORF Transcript_22054/g.86720 Transcript_22054/m.86720 type:complete len:231 (+) Transcript_22054:480-1172(+)